MRKYLLSAFLFLSFFLTAAQFIKTASIQQLEKTAKALLTADKKIIDIFVHLELIPCLDTIETENLSLQTLGYYPLQNTPYQKYEKLEMLLSETYALQSTIDAYLSYPSHGKKLFKNRNGQTLFSPYYLGKFSEQIDLSSVQVAKKEAHRAVISFLLADGQTRESLEMAHTEDGWRLCDSLYFKRHTPQTLPFTTSGIKNTGSVKTLKGNTLLINLFVTDNESDFSKEEIKQTEITVKDAIFFLQDTAKSYGISLSIQSVVLPVFSVPQIPNGIEDASLPVRLLAHSPYGSMETLLSSVSAGQNYDSVCVFFHANKNGKSYASPQTVSLPIHQTDETEWAFLFHGSSSPAPFSASVFAHELLHLAGAPDLYYPAEDTSLQKTLAPDYFPYDLMRIVPKDIQTARIGAYTAFQIGWLTALPEELLLFSLSNEK